MAAPHREKNTAVINSVTVPSNRRALFLAVGTEVLHDKLSDELSFDALSPNDRAMFQFLLYLTYCCKGEFLQVTLENPDFSSMSPPVREDFAHGRMFCFILDMNTDSSHGQQSSSDTPTFHGNADEYSGTQLLDLLDMNVNMDVFRRDGVEEDGGDDDDDDEDNDNGADTAAVKETLEEAFNSFMRLQLVRKKASSLNNAMIVKRDSEGQLSSMFDWLDLHRDTLNSSKVDKKKVKELQGSMYTPAFQSGRQVTSLPQTITDLSLKALDNSIGRITDSVSEGEGKRLFLSITSKLTGAQWMQQKVIQTAYNMSLPKDVAFVKKLRVFTRELAALSGTREVNTGGLLVFRYSLEKVITRENPELFVKLLIHRHVSVSKTRIDKVLCDIKSKRRTRDLASLLNDGNCHCKEKDRAGECSGDCQIAYSIFYNSSEQHPFTVSQNDHNCYFTHLYPHLGRLERLSKEMKVKYRGCRQFESIANMVFHILARHQFGDGDSLYQGLGDVMNNRLSSSSLSLSYNLKEVHESLCLQPSHGDGDYSEDPYSLTPVKVYDHALVRHLFCDSLQVGRLFQASTTFNYIIANTAPRYTIERVMLFNVTGPGEGKSYANNVLNYQFNRVKGCIETLTSFTPQAFKYKQKRTSCVVMIDDAHIAHEKTTRAVDKESNVIPNTFKNLLDTSKLESDVVTRDMSSGKVDTVKHRAVHNCGFVWNSNTMGFVSAAWADRCVIMESEYPKLVTRTRSTKQIQDTVQRCYMDMIAAICLYRQNLVQSCTMIAESDVMQFSIRFDKARDAFLSALYASHIVCTGVLSRRVSFCINQLVFAEAMKLACHFVFDIWIPPWTEIPEERECPDLRTYMRRMDTNRLKALDKLTFGQICLETNVVYKLCVAACLPDICPRGVDIQGRFACKALGYVLTQIHQQQQLKTSLKNDGHMCISGINAMFFSETEIGVCSATAHEMLMLCSTCKFPARKRATSTTKGYKLCTYRYATTQNAPHVRGCSVNHPKKVGSITIPLEAVYDMLAIYAPDSHSGFWDQIGAAMLEAYENGDFETVNALGQCSNDGGDDGGDQPPPVRRVTFTLDFTEDRLRTTILEATAAIEPLNELTFAKYGLGGETIQCSAPLYYGNVIRRALGQSAPEGSYNKRHARESRVGPRGTFHGPRLSVYSTDYSGVPVKNASSFCNTRTMYHQDRIFLRLNQDDRRHLVELEEDWEWKDAVDVYNTVHGSDVFSVEMLKRDYATTMMATKGEPTTQRPRLSTKLVTMIRTLQASDGCAALELRRGKTRTYKVPEERGTHQRQPQDSPCDRRRRKRSSEPRDSPCDRRRRKRRKRSSEPTEAGQRESDSPCDRRRRKRRKRSSEPTEAGQRESETEMGRN